MSIAYTSAVAYSSIKDLNHKQSEVLSAIEELQPCSNKQIARALKWEINRVTGRVNELAKKGFIKSEKMAKNDVGRLEKLWEVKNENTRRNENRH